jgi:uncharacterized protein YdaU (DUF1376 family)
MASDFPFMKLWVEDALNDMQEMGLDDEEFGAYWKLLLFAWKREGIPADLKERARFVTANPQRLRRLEKAFGHKFVPDGEDRLVNPKQELVREDARSKSKTASESANARWEKVRRERAERELEEEQAA